jgi:hypothetical protein
MRPATVRADDGGRDVNPFDMTFYGSDAVARHIERVGGNARWPASASAARCGRPGAAPATAGHGPGTPRGGTVSRHGGL